MIFDVCVRHFVRVNIIQKHDYAERAATEGADRAKTPPPSAFSFLFEGAALKGRYYMSIACKIRLMVLSGARCDIVTRLQKDSIT